MGRHIGDITFPSTLQVKKQEMLDPRMGVDKIEDLTAKDTFPSDGDTIYMKEGMCVSVKENKGIYMLKDIKNIHSLEEGWHKLNPSAKEYLTYIAGYAVNKEEVTIDGQNGINLIGTNGVDVKLGEQYTKLPSNVPYRTIEIDGQGIKKDILDDNGKILPSLMPQYIAGGLMYGGTIENRAGLNLFAPDDIYIKPTSSYINKHNIAYGTEEIKVTEEEFLASGHEGEYFIVVAPNATDISGYKESFSWGELHFDVGDWFISNGNIWTKIDNAESVKSVGEMTGDISAESLAKVLSSDRAKNNKLATNAELISINTELTSAQDSISNIQESISDIDNIRSNASKGALAVQRIKLNGMTNSPNEHGVVDLGVIRGGDGTPNALFCAGTITGALAVNNNNYAKVKVNEVFEDKYGYTSNWQGIELEDGKWGKVAYLEPGEYKLICKGAYNIPGSATPLFVPITLRINDKLSGWKDIFNRGFINVKYNEYSEKDFLLEAVSTYSSGHMGFFTETITRDDILLGTYIIYLTIKEGGKYEFSGYISNIQNDPNNYIIDEISLETKITEVVLVRTKDPSLVDTIRQIQALDHQGCYFVMGKDVFGSENILGLDATADDWIVAQGPSWVKVTTTDRTIAGITGNVSAEDLASKLSGISNENLSLATKAEAVLMGNEDDSKDADTYYGLKKYIETGKTALFCAGRIIGARTQSYQHPYAQVEINDAFKAKYGDNESSHTSVELANKRTIYDNSIRQLIASEHEGCYFVMDILEDNDNILGLNASYGDWVISQGNTWVKISTVGSNIAGFTGDVTDGQLANKLSQRSETNTTPLARQDELDGVIKGVKVNGAAVDANENGVVDITTVRANWEQENKSKTDYIENKPFGRADGIIISDIKDYDISGMTTPEEPQSSWSFRLYSSLPYGISFGEGKLGQMQVVNNSQNSGIENDIVRVQVVSPSLAVVTAGTGYSGWLSTYPIELCWKNAVKKLDPKYLPDEAVKVGSESDTETAKTYYGLKRNFDSALESFDALKVDKVEGKGLSTEDFTTLLKQKLESLQNYDDTAVNEAVNKLRGDFDALITADASGTIDKFNEIVAFLANIEDSQSLDSIIASIEQQIASKANKSDIVQADMADLIPSSKAYVKNNPLWMLRNRVSIRAGRKFTFNPIRPGVPTYLYAEGYDDANGSGVVRLQYKLDGTSSVAIRDASRNIVVTITYLSEVSIELSANIDCIINLLVPKVLPLDFVDQQQSDWLNCNPLSPKYIENKQFGYIPVANIVNTGTYHLDFPGNADTNNIFVYVYQKDGTYYNDDVIYMGEETTLVFDGLQGGLIFDLSNDGTLVVKPGDGYNAWLTGVDVFVVVNTWFNESVLPPRIVNLKKDIIQEYLHIKPTVKIYHSRNRENSMVYGNHPYLDEVGHGELVVMHYGKSSKKQYVTTEDEEVCVRINDTRWKELLGAPYKLPDSVAGDWRGARFTEPATLADGTWSSYSAFVSDICARATRVKITLNPDYEDVYVSMAQEMARVNSNDATELLSAHFYDRWENDGKLPYKIFVGNTNSLKIGVALRVLNPEFQELLDGGIIDESDFGRRRWYVNHEQGLCIPKYLYSDVCEMTISTGSLKEMLTAKHPLKIPRLSVK